MTRYTAMRFLCLTLIVCSGMACAPKQTVPPVTSVNGYTISLDVSDARIWLGPRAGGSDHRPDTVELLVQVHNAQGKPVNGVPVEFAVEPSWRPYARMLPPHTLTRAGIARTVFEPRTTGVVEVMVQVNGQTQIAAITVESRNFGNSGAR